MGWRGHKLIVFCISISHKFQSIGLNFNNNQGEFSNLRANDGQLAIIFVGT